MNVDVEIWSDVSQHPWKWQNGRIDVVGAIIHSTRSGIPGRTAELEFQSAVNWFKSPNNRVLDSAGNPWYGGMSNYIIGGGQVCMAVPESLVPRFSAGIHDFRGISIEMGQGTVGDPFDPRDIELLHKLLDDLSDRYGFPLTRIAYVDGNNVGWPGLVGHEDTAQGRQQGKTDPGPLLWQQLFEDDMTPEDKATFDALVKIMGGRDKIIAAAAADMDYLLGYELEQADQNQLEEAVKKLQAAPAGSIPPGTKVKLEGEIL